MKLKIITAALLFTTLTGMAQTQGMKPLTTGKVVKQGTILVDGYYGLPFLVGSLLKSVNTSAGGSTVTGLSVQNLNHIGGRFEYMLSEKFGIGLEYTYARATAKYIDSYPNGSGGVSSGSFTDAFVKQRALLRMAFHFGESDKLDPYFCFGGGYKNLKYTSDNLNYTQAEIKALSAGFNPIPVAIRVGGGVRYFFTENIGVNAEIGFGGPLVQVGVSAKF